MLCIFIILHDDSNHRLFLSYIYDERFSFELCPICSNESWDPLHWERMQRPDGSMHNRSRSRSRLRKSRSSFRNGAPLFFNNKLRTGCSEKKNSSGFIDRFPASLDHCVQLFLDQTGHALCTAMCLCYEMQSNLRIYTLRCLCLALRFLPPRGM